MFAECLSEVETYVEATRRYQAPLLPNPVYVDLNFDSIRLKGAIPQVSAAGLLDYGFSNISGKRLLALWIRHLCLCASTDPSVIAHRSVLIGGGESKVETFVLKAVKDPTKHLKQLVQHYQEGRTQALPFFPKSSYFYASKIIKPGSRTTGEEKIKKAAMNKALNKWNDINGKNGAPDIPGECKDAAIRRFFGTKAPFEPAESRFIDLSLDIYIPIFNHREVQA